MAKILTLTTDFGLNDPTVAIMKGVMLGINPELRIIDVTHKITPQDITGATLCVSCFNDYFPEGTIHLVVVDPGVGSTRDPVIIQTERYFYVGPNNGIFSMIDGNVKKMVKIENDKYFRKSVSKTFHGRDIFAPVAAHLATAPIDDFGSPLEELEKSGMPEPMVSETGLIEGEIVYFDHFGNAYTNITTPMLLKIAELFPGGELEIRLGEHTVAGLSNYYKQVPPKTLGAIMNSFGFLELFTPNGNAGKAFKLKKGDSVGITFHSKSESDE